jgi:DNA-directed RNA polymerase specialized sigma24 family protein
MFLKGMQLEIDSAAEQSILSALREGNKRQVASLLIRYYGNAVYSLCWGQVLHFETAEDLTHDAFRRAFTSLGDFHGERSARGWLIAIARECCMDYLKHSPQGRESRDRALEAEGGSAGSAEGSIGELKRVSDSLQRRLEALASAL